MIEPALAVVGDDEAAQNAAAIRRLLARGSDIELANGDVVTIVYTARICAQIEVEYGSIVAYLDELQKGTGGRIFKALSFTLGLVLRQPVDTVWDLIDTRRLRDYVDAMGAASLEAFPPRDDPGNASGPTTAPSPGPDSSTSAASPFPGALHPSSGT